MKSNLYHKQTSANIRSSRTIRVKHEIIKLVAC